MSIVSGISTAPGISPLLNAPRETQQILRLDASAATSQTADSSKVVDLSTRARPVTGVAREANSGQFQDIRTSTDDRYSRFVKAVQALRIDPTDEILDDRRVAELIEAAEGFFLVDDGVPREVQPLPPDASIRIEPIQPDPEPELWEQAVEDSGDKAEESDELALESQRSQNDAQPTRAETTEEAAEQSAEASEQTREDAQAREAEERKTEQRKQREPGLSDQPPEDPEPAD